MGNQIEKMAAFIQLHPAAVRKRPHMLPRPLKIRGIIHISDDRLIDHVVMHLIFDRSAAIAPHGRTFDRTGIALRFEQRICPRAVPRMNEHIRIPHCAQLGDGITALHFRALHKQKRDICRRKCCFQRTNVLSAADCIIDRGIKFLMQLCAHRLAVPQPCAALHIHDAGYLLTVREPCQSVPVQPIRRRRGIPPVHMVAQHLQEKLFLRRKAGLCRLRHIASSSRRI